MKNKLLKDPEFKEALIHEVVNLKKNAKPEELAKLSLSQLNAELRAGCIYGQMTGDCFSKRAVTLIRKCCSRVIEEGAYDKLNGSPKKFRAKSRWGSESFTPYFSPIEIYISSNGFLRGTSKARAKKVVNFLTGKSETFSP